MYLRRCTNLYFDSINSNFYHYTCGCNVGSLHGIKFLSRNMCNLDQLHCLRLWVGSRSVQLEPGTLNLEYCKRNILKHFCLKFNTSAINITLINWAQSLPVRFPHGKQNLSREQVNLLVYGPDRLHFKQKQKNITKFWPTDFFFTPFFSAFWKK